MWLTDGQHHHNDFSRGCGHFHLRAWNHLWIRRGKNFWKEMIQRLVEADVEEEEREPEYCTDVPTERSLLEGIDEKGKDMTAKGSNAELKKIIYWITAGLTSILVTVGGYMYVRMEERVSIVESNQTISIELNKRVSLLEDGDVNIKKELSDRNIEFTRQIAVLTAQMDVINKTLDNMQQTQIEILKSIEALRIADIKRENGAR